MCLAVVPDVEFQQLETSLRELKRTLLKLNARVEQNEKINDDDADEFNRMSEMLSCTESNRNELSDTASRLLQTLSASFTDSLFADNDVDNEHTLLRLARLFVETSFPTVLGTWGYSSSDKRAHTKSGVWLSLAMRASFLDSVAASGAPQLDATFWRSFTDSRRGTDQQHACDEVPFEAHVQCYGYSLSSVQIVLFDTLHDRQYFAAFPLDFTLALPQAWRDTQPTATVYDDGEDSIADLRRKQASDNTVLFKASSSASGSESGADTVARLQQLDASHISEFDLCLMQMSHVAQTNKLVQQHLSPSRSTHTSSTAKANATPQSTLSYVITQFISVVCLLVPFLFRISLKLTKFVQLPIGNLGTLAQISHFASALGNYFYFYFWKFLILFVIFNLFFLLQVERKKLYKFTELRLVKKNNPNEL